MVSFCRRQFDNKFKFLLPAFYRLGQKPLTYFVRGKYHCVANIQFICLFLSACWCWTNNKFTSFIIYKPVKQIVVQQLKLELLMPNSNRLCLFSLLLMNEPLLGPFEELFFNWPNFVCFHNFRTNKCISCTNQSKSEKAFREKTSNRVQDFWRGDTQKWKIM